MITINKLGRIDVRITGHIIHEGSLYVFTDTQVYRMEGDRFVPVDFVISQEIGETS